MGLRHKKLSHKGRNEKKNSGYKKYGNGRITYCLSKKILLAYQADGVFPVIDIILGDFQNVDVNTEK
ncbi:hypothetical protein AB9M93_10775 [Peribacillus frigoritolerans]